MELDWNILPIVFVRVIVRGIHSIVIENKTLSIWNILKLLAIDFYDFSVGDSTQRCLVSLAVMVQGGEMFHLSDIFVSIRLLSPLMR